MSTTPRRPLHAAAAAGAAALVALAVVVPASAADIAELKARAQALGDEVSVLETRLDKLSGREAELDRRISDTSAEIGILEMELSERERAADAAHDVVVQRAVEAYKAGTTTDRLALVLSAEDVTDMIAAAEATGHAAEADTVALDELVAEQEALEDAQARVDARKQTLLAAQAEAETLAEEAALALAERSEVLEQLTDEVAELERKARAAAAQAARPDQAFLDLLSPSGPSPGIPDGFVGTGVTFEGLASWYGPGFEGNLTASGDVFDSSLYTAASKELPLGTWLYVEYNGRGVVVLVNDRGPYVEPRILDLSRGAAQAIGMEHAGVGWVKAEILLEK
ncbi:MAG TPA: septal ring lytic transglycosylase RlpA family protein [Actinomycetota bacterium]|nr:septal ring lytic transglycosylase RlpA family protein [Actinomycetota bacterium]